MKAPLVLFYFISPGFSLNELQQETELLGTCKRFVPLTLKALYQVAASMPEEEIQSRA